MNNKERVAVIILNWNGWRDTLDCINSLQHLSSPKLEVLLVVVDNGSTDESLQELSNKPEFKLITCEVNKGFAKGCNVGIRESLNSPCDYVLLLNNDTVVGPNFLNPLINTFHKVPSVGIISPKIYYSEPSNQIWYAGGKFRQPRIIGEMVGLGQIDSGQYNQEVPTDFAVGCCMITRNSVFQKIGLLDERFFFYHEDVDFSIRASQAGFQVWYQPDSYIFHKVSHSTEHDSSLRAFLEAESRIVFFAKHIHGIRLIGVFILEFFRTFRVVLKSILTWRKSISVSYIQGLLSGFKRARSYPGRQ